MRTLAALALALLLVTAGCSGFGGTPDAPPTVAPDLRGTPTADPTATPTATPGSDASLPPGVTPGEDDAVDERALYLAHDRALENRSVTWRSQQFRTNETGSVQGWSTRTARVDGPRQRYEVATGGANPAAVRVVGTAPDYWTNGSVTVSRVTLRNGSVRRRVADGPPPGSFADVGTGRVVVSAALAGTDLRYVGAERRTGTLLHVLAGTAPDSRLTMRVTSEGVVRSLVSRTETRVDGANVTVVNYFRAYDVGTTVVDRPEWATNATGR